MFQIAAEFSGSEAAPILAFREPDVCGVDADGLEDFRIFGQITLLKARSGKFATIHAPRFIVQQSLPAGLFSRGCAIKYPFGSALADFQPDLSTIARHEGK